MKCKKIIGIFQKNSIFEYRRRAIEANQLHSNDEHDDSVTNPVEIFLDFDEWIIMDKKLKRMAR